MPQFDLNFITMDMNVHIVHTLAHNVRVCVCVCMCVLPLLSVSQFLSPSVAYVLACFSTSCVLSGIPCASVFVIGLHK